MYSVPARQETYGTLKIFGTWFKKKLKERRIVWHPKLTKSNFGYMREKLDFSTASIKLHWIIVYTLTRL
jgi:hypothetical protein